VQVGVTDVSHIQTLYGTANPVQAREHVPKTICYVDTKSSSPTYVSFEAGPLGGWNAITGIALFEKHPDLDERIVCKESETIGPLVRDLIERGFRLREDESWFLNRFGIPSKSSKDRLEFRQASRIRSSFLPHTRQGVPGMQHDEEDVDVVYNLIVTFSSGKSIRVRWTKTESN